jgi:starch synthase
MLLQARPLLAPAGETTAIADGEQWASFTEAKRVAAQRTQALEALTDLAEKYGAVHELDVEVLANKLAGDAASALRQTYAELCALKQAGRLESPDKAETISEGLLLQLESKEITGRAAGHVHRTAGLELYRLFDRPGRDDELRKTLGEYLKTKLKVSDSALRERERERPLTKLAEEHERKRTALAAILLRSDLPKALLEMAIEKMGEVGKPEDVARIERAAEKHSDLAPVVKRASEMIERAKSMKIVLVGFEAAPYCKVGGLSNVLGIGELPHALARAGHDVSVIVPGHQVIDHGEAPANHPPLVETGEIGTVYGRQAKEFGIFESDAGGVRYLFVEQNDYFSADRGGVYKDQRGDYGDQAERYDFFSAAAPVLMRTVLDRPPDIVELEDSHVGAGAEYIRRDPWFKGTGTVFTVHNAKEGYQGRFDRGQLDNMRYNGLGLHAESGNDAEAYGHLCNQKIGVTRSDCTRTVAFKYMFETQDGGHPEQPGGGMHGLFWSKFQEGRYWAASNGMNLDDWNPATDPLLPATYSFQDQSGKKTCKAEVQAAFGLNADPGAIVFGAVARADRQKGLDDLDASVRRMMAKEPKAQVVICSDAINGDPAIVDSLRRLAADFPGRVAYDGKFSSKKEHLILAGSDFYLMPSRFEPHGLPQMYAISYLTVPIGRAVGGIDEVIESFDPKTGKGNGFKFDQDMNAAIDQALEWYNSGEDARQVLMRNMALSAPEFSWDTRTVPELVALFRKVLNDKAYFQSMRYARTQA